MDVPSTARLRTRAAVPSACVASVTHVGVPRTYMAQTANGSLENADFPCMTPCKPSLSPAWPSELPWFCSKEKHTTPRSVHRGL